MTQIVKGGYLRRYSKSMLSGGWQNVYVILYSDSNLVLYKRQGDNEIKGKVHMKEVSKRFAYGEHTSGMPDRPDPPKGATFNQMLAIPTRNNSKAKIYYFICASETDLHEWMTAICSTLPPPPARHHHEQPIQPSAAAPVQGAPPPYSNTPQYAPGPPQPQPAGIGFAPVAGGGNYPQAPYPSQPYPAQPGGPMPYPNQQPQGMYQPPPPQAYPQQQYAPPPPQGYPQQQYQQPYAQPGYGYQQPGYAPQQQPPQVVYVQQGGGHKKKSGGLGGIMGSNTGKVAAGVLGGAALGYGASRMMGGFGGFGFGHHGSWSSLSSFGSCGSFGSFGSFD